MKHSHIPPTAVNRLGTLVPKPLPLPGRPIVQAKPAIAAPPVYRPVPLAIHNPAGRVGVPVTSMVQPKNASGQRMAAPPVYRPTVPPIQVSAPAQVAGRPLAGVLNQQASQAIQAKMQAGRAALPMIQMKPAGLAAMRPAPAASSASTVVQPLLTIANVEYGAKKGDITKLRKALGKDVPDVVKSLLVRIARNKNKNKEFASKREAVMWVVSKYGAARLLRVHERNLEMKAKPVRTRRMYKQQAELHGENRGTIDYSISKGSFRPGFGGQPFFSSNKNDFNGAVVKSDYDSLVSVLGGDDEQDNATAILDLIYDKKYDKKAFTSEEDRAIADIVSLTQIIEPSTKRITGIDKLARSSFRAISEGRSTFSDEFNRTDGVFVVTHTAKNSGHGGQDVGRDLFNLPRKKSDKSHLTKKERYGSYVRALEMSDSSEDEESD